MNRLGPRERILETASRLFYTQGYNNTGINQILDEAKVAKASLYLHFGSKDELGIHYLKAGRKEWFEGVLTTPPFGRFWRRALNEPAIEIRRSCRPALSISEKTARSWA